VIETIRGLVLKEVTLPGYLVDRDDFNDQRPPYTFVRPGGRAGSCFANSYRSGGQFLLFLATSKDGELTVNWYALAPVNEQLHSDSDPCFGFGSRRIERTTGESANKLRNPRKNPAVVVSLIWFTN
jgi:hypothetical protein